MMNFLTVNWFEIFVSASQWSDAADWGIVLDLRRFGMDKKSNRTDLLAAGRKKVSKFLLSY